MQSNSRKQKHKTIPVWSIIGAIFLFMLILSGCPGVTEDPPVEEPNTPTLSTEKEITSFSFESPAVTGTITGTDIALTVPYGTAKTALVATFTTTGSAVTVGSTAQISGTTASDFTSSVTYTVTAADSSTQNYTVTVTVAQNDAKEITSFSFESLAVTGTITGTDIALTVPYGTAKTALVATFTTSGSTVTIGSTPQTSGTTTNNFTTPVTYTVTAADSSTQDYTVTVTVAQNDAKEITSFSFESLTPTVTGTITGTDIALTVPYGTTKTALVATFTTSGSAVTVGSTAQINGTTSNDFTTSVTYTVTAADSSTQNYTVTVTVAQNDAKEITDFSFESLTPIVTSTITGTDITLTVPYGTDASSLVATFTTTGSAVTVDSTPQTSGTTANDFTSAVTYVVTAANSSIQNYTVTVVVTAAPKEITAFSFESLTPIVNGVISGTDIAITMPYGTTVTSLVATFTTSGTAITVGSTPQTSGTTANDFTSAVTYVVTAADNTTQDYTIIVTISDLQIGDEGPAGGLIFYVDTDDGFPGWKYLEAAPLNWEGDSDNTDPYYEWGGFGAACGSGDTSTGLGTGEANTLAIRSHAHHDAISGSPYHIAALQAYNAVINGFSDWFLPSSGELLKMYYNLHIPLGGFNGTYWSSSQYDSMETWVVQFTHPYQQLNTSYKKNNGYVRPVRAF